MTMQPRAPSSLIRALLFLAKGALRLALGSIFTVVTAVLVLSGYALCKAQPFAAPELLRLTELDRAVPFLPWTVWIYGSMTAAFFAAWVLVPSARLARRLLIGLLLSAAICWVFFALFPTTYPRELYPLAAGGDESAAELLRIRFLDDPANCFPSMHVALASCIALTMLDYKLAWPGRVAVVLWALAISASTLTTKQHYVIDVPAGALVGAAAYAVARWAARPGRRPIWDLGTKPIRLTHAGSREVIAALRQKRAERTWSIDELPWPARAPEPLSPDAVRFVSQVIYVEEIAGENFDLLARAAEDDDLRVLYAQFAADERRHAEGLRRVLRLHGAEPGPPGLGCSMLLHQFPLLDPKSDADALLVALTIPVFETFLDAGTIPFLRRHRALAGEAFDELVKHICRDESSHLAVNWNVGRSAARAVKTLPLRSWGGLRFLLNPAVLRGALATPFLAIDVYGNALRIGFDFRALLPSFKRLFSLHRLYPELAWFPSWFLFRIFVLCGVIATFAVLVIDRLAPRLLRSAVRLQIGLTDQIAAASFSNAWTGERCPPSSDPPIVSAERSPTARPSQKEGEI
jgi:membrane-associated phospholipid phosphatase